MSARVLDGTAVANQIREELRPRIAEFTARAGRPPGLGIVLAGDNPGSEIYVATKLKSAGDVGCRTDLIRVPATASLDEALAAVQRLNEDDSYDGILVQSPLPEGMGSEAEQVVFDTIDPAKDVDGFTPVNVGLLVQNRAHLVPCTPRGVIELLRRSGIELKGHACRRGRAQRHRREAHGDAAAPRARHGDDLPFADEGPAIGRARGGPRRGCNRPHRLRAAGAGSSRARR